MNTPIRSLAFPIAFLGLLALPSQAQTGLPYYLDQARAHSPLIQDYRNQGEAARLEAGRLKALYTKPQLTLNAAYQVTPIYARDSGNEGDRYNDASPQNYYGYDLAVSNGGLYSATLAYTQPLWNGGRYQATTGQANTLSQVNQNLAQLTAHDLEKLITDQYILCLQDNRQVAYFERLTILIGEQLGVVSSLVKSGLLKQSDLTLLDIEYKTQQTALQTFQATYFRDLMDLNALSGTGDTTRVTLADLNLSLGTPVEDSQFLNRYRLDSLSLVAAQKVFDLKYKPQVNLFANAGLNAVHYQNILHRFGMSAGLNFTWYLYDGHQQGLNHQRTQVLLQTTEAYGQNFRVQNAVRKSKLLTELRLLEERRTLLQSQLQAYDRLLAAYRQEVTRGQLSVINYINTLKNAVTVNRDYLLLETNRQLLINAYNYWNW